MIAKIPQTSNIKGSSLTSCAHGSGGASTRIILKPAEKFGRPSEGAAEGGCGGNSAAPEPEAPHQSKARCGINSARRLFVQNKAEQKNYLFLLEELFGGARKSENAKAIFLRGVPSHGTAAGRSGWFRSAILDKMSSSRVVKTHQKNTPGSLEYFSIYRVH